MVLLMGQYSVGKSTFIQHMLEQDYPGLRIVGPEVGIEEYRKN
jgi:EH domain-containing protein 1